VRKHQFEKDMAEERAAERVHVIGEEDLVPPTHSVDAKEFTVKEREAADVEHAIEKKMGTAAFLAPYDPHGMYWKVVEQTEIAAIGDGRYIARNRYP